MPATPSVPSVDYLGSPAFFGEGMNGANNAIETANRQITLANQYISRLGQLVGGIELPVIDPSFPTVGDAPAISVVPMPDLEAIVWVQPPMPEAFTGTLTVNDLLPDPFEEDAPDLIFPTAPSELSELAPAAPGVDVEYDYPELSLSLPAAPQLLQISVANFAGVTIPEFSEDAPTLTAMEPSTFVYNPGALYTSQLLTDLKNELHDRIVNGGTGLNADVENAIWDRAREREYRQKADSLKALEEMEQLGYSLPSGAYLDARVKIETEVNYNIQTLSRDIAIKQAELEQANVLKALDAANQLEARLIEYQNQTEQRTFEAARYASQANVEIYNAKVRAYTATVDAYRARVTAYEAQVRGLLAKVEAYKAQVDAELAKANVNRAVVDMYKTQIDAELANVEIFKARIAGIQAKAEVEKLKISIYGEQIKGYLGRINAYTAQVEGYKARVSAEGTKQEAFRSKVQAYVAQVDAATKSSEARIREFEAKIAAKNAEYDAFKSRVQAESARVQGIASANQALIDGYKAEVSGTSAYNETITKQWQASIELAARVAEIGVQTAKMNAELYVTTRQVAMEASKVGAQVSAQLGAAALNAINYNNSISYSNSNSRSQSGSASNSSSVSESTSESTSENTNYNYSA